MRPLSTQLPSFAEAMLLSLEELGRFEPFWFYKGYLEPLHGDDFDDAMMDFGTALASSGS